MTGGDVTDFHGRRNCVPPAGALGRGEKMKNLLGFMLAVLVAVVGASAQSSQPPQTTQPTEVVNPPFSIAIRAPQNVVKTGSEVNVKIALTNTSKEDLYFLVTGVFDYVVDVHYFATTSSPANMAPANMAPENMAPLTDRGRKIKQTHGTFAGSAIRTRLKPGVTVEDDCAVTDFYDMTRPGRYVIQLQHDIPTNPNQIVKSNVITVTVTP
jgi:hypothetical protein